MIRIFARSGYRCVAPLSKSTYKLCAQPCYKFANNIDFVSKLKQAIDTQITHEESSIVDLSEYQNFYKKQGWALKYHGIQVQLSKKNGPYELRVLFNAKTPLPSQDQPQEEQIQQDNQDYTDVTIYIKKEGAAKWLSCEFLISGKNNAHLGLATFITDYESERADRAKGKSPSSGYTGPQLSSLQQGFQASISTFIEQVGINRQIFETAVDFSTAYQHRFYIEWLKDIRSLV